MASGSVGFVNSSVGLTAGRRTAHAAAARAATPMRMVATSKSTASSPLWTPASWRSMPIKQVPSYPDEAALADVEKRLGRSLPLVFSGECERLKDQLHAASLGEAFLLQGGDCAESFEEFEKYGGTNIRDTFTLLIQMSILMMYAIRKPVVKIGRMAGQFAKPRSSPFERVKNKELELPSYRGDMINGPSFTLDERTPDPERMYRAFIQSTSTINLLRTLASGGYMDLHRIHDINLKFVDETPQGSKFREFASAIDNALSFMASCGLQTDSPMLRQAEFYVSHEALLLPYEEALTRIDPNTGKAYATSGHFLWLGDRTRQPDGAHVEFLRGIANPIGVKCGPTITEDDLLQLLDTLNPTNEPGRITLIARVGAGKVREHLPRMIEAVRREGRSVTWSCDPMHGNTESAESGFKTRNFENVFSEVKDFLDVHHEMGSIPGGIHLEMTGQNVTECIGGMRNVRSVDLPDRYETQCDPRLNASQSLELAFLVSEKLQQMQAEES